MVESLTIRPILATEPTVIYLIVSFIGSLRVSTVAPLREERVAAMCRDGLRIRAS